jgi:hypothetical protein
MTLKVRPDSLRSDGRYNGPCHGVFDRSQILPKDATDETDRRRHKPTPVEGVTMFSAIRNAASSPQSNHRRRRAL